MTDADALPESCPFSPLTSSDHRYNTHQGGFMCRFCGRYTDGEHSVPLNRWAPYDVDGEDG